MLHGEARSDKNQPLSYDYTWSGNQKTGELKSLAVVSLSGVKLLTVATDTPWGGPTAITADWAPGVASISHVQATSDGTTLSGTVDGEPFGPVALTADPSSVTFTDGTPIPGPGLSPRLRHALDQAVKKAKKATAFCKAGSSGVTVQPQSQTSSGDDPPDYGHGSYPQGSSACAGCYTKCYGAGALAGAACAAAFAIPVAGVVLGVACEAAASAGVSLCIKHCHKGGSDCCPVSCGSYACCDSAESCLTSSKGLCCSSGKHPCASEQCCTSSESCIDSGPNTGTCCPSTNLCGQDCCDSSETCLNTSTSLCCPTTQVCGSTCCGAVSYCANSSTGQCCLYDEVYCGDKCCPSGYTCNAAQQCEPVPPTPPSECKKQGRTPCSQSGDCVSYEYCDNGCCANLPG